MITQPAAVDDTALRERIASLFPPKLFMAHRDNIADGVMAVVQPVLAAKDATIERLRTFLGSLVDPDDCRIVDGGCQAHGYLDLAPGEQCPIQAAKDLLTSWPVAEPAEATGDAPPTLAETRTGHDWCTTCEDEAGTNRCTIGDVDQCATCAAPLVPLPAAEGGDRHSAPFGKPYESCVLDAAGTCSRPSHTHDATTAEQTATESTAPRVWHEGDPEPIEDGLELATPVNDVFSRRPNGEWVSDIGRGDWAALTAHFKELTEKPAKGGDRG